MKYLMYLFGVIIGLILPAEYVAFGCLFILVGIVFHLDDIKTDINNKISELEKSIQSDHAYLKRDINNLVNQK